MVELLRASFTHNSPDVGAMDTGSTPTGHLRPLACDLVKTHMTRRHGLLWTGAVTATLALVASACGTNNNTPSAASTTTTQPATATTTAVPVACATGTLSGAGSTFVSTLATQWIKDYEAQCAGSTINYAPVGSGAGVQQFVAGTVNFGATDVPVGAADQAAAQAKGGTLVQLPWAAGGIAIEYNVPGVTNLQLSPSTLASIFAGKITTWNDPAIKTDNPSATLPATTIATVHRSDSSGTTAAYTAYLAASAPTVWTLGSSKTINWPGGQGAKGSDGVSALVSQTQGSIGYAEVSFAKGASLSMASIKNAAGSFTQPTGAGVAASIGAATPNPDGSVTLSYTAPDPAAYPISTVSYVVAFVKQGAAVGALLKDFLGFAVNKGQQDASTLFYAPLPSSLVTSDTTAINTITTS
jgi:phosphate transport system substrate-binding protein